MKPVITGFARRFAFNRSGAAAVEFVLVVPLFLLTYLGAIDMSQGIETSKNVSRASGIIANIVAQQQSVVTTQLDDIMEIGAAALFPYERDTPRIKITAIQVAPSPQTNPSAKVVWSRAKGLASDAANNVIDIPEAFRINNLFLIKVEVALSYKPITTWGLRNIASVDQGLPLSEIYYFAPINSVLIPCSNC
jgi:Flp pilus assembly protein TadG